MDFFEMNNKRVLENPDDHEARLNRAQTVFDLGVNSQILYQFDVLDELDYIITKRPEMNNTFWAQLYILRARYKTYYENSFERAVDDYMLALRFDAVLSRESLIQNISTFTYYTGRNPIMDRQIEEVIKGFTLYKLEVFQSPVRNHYYFLFDELTKLAKLFLENGQIEKAKELADMLCDWIPHDKLRNTPEVDKYLGAWELQCLIAMHNRDDNAFMTNFYLYVGAPYQQRHSYNQELLNYFNFSVEYKDYYWYMCKAIMDCQLAFDEIGMSDFRRRIFRSVDFHLKEAEKFDSQSDFYMTYFMKSIYAFEVLGNTQEAFNYIEKAILYNPEDICAHLFKLHIMNMDRNYAGKITYYDAEVEKALQDDKAYSNYLMHEVGKTLIFKPIPNSILIKLREYSSFPRN